MPSPLVTRCLDLLASRNMCVLATCDPTSSHGNSDAAPHTSLMAYTLDEERRHLLMVSPANSKKVRNLSVNPMVSCMVDTREDALCHGKNRYAVQALTVTARLTSPSPDEAPALVEQVIAAHPHLETFARKPGNSVVRLEITAFQLLDGLEDAQYATL